MQESNVEKFSNVTELVEMVALLRSPQGCPWDRNQTLHSVKRLLLDEVYEAIQAIEDEDLPALAEELGDLLLLIIFSAQLATEKAAFTLNDVINQVNEKIYRRHPHVFGSEKASTPTEAKAIWDKIKRKEKPGFFLLDQVPVVLPALSYCQSIQERASSIGFDWDSPDAVVRKLNEELNELFEATSLDERTQEIGDVLFTVVNLARKYGIYAEDALRGSGGKFIQRFEAMCELAEKKELNFEELSLEAKNSLWEEVKFQEDNNG